MDYIIEEIEKLNIEKKFKELIFFKDAIEHSLEWGMNYIFFSPSKRIRPLILLESNLIYSDLDNDSYILSSALEMIHTYSLVHDDLPCMDDDDLRRGVKTLHKIKDEAYALLVGDALLTRSFEILSMYTKKDKLPQIIDIFCKKSGHKGIIYGQILDLEGEGKNLEIESINKINKYKTSSLFELALIAGAINGGASNKDIKLLEELGSLLGYIFQLKDDILDIVGDSKLLGKNIGSDEKNKKSSIPLIIGIEKTKEMLYEYEKKSINCIEKLPANKTFFYKLLDFILKRKR